MLQPDLTPPLSPVDRFNHALDSGKFERSLAKIDRCVRSVKIRNLNYIQYIGTLGTIAVEDNPSDIELTLNLSVFYGRAYAHISPLLKNGITTSLARSAYETLQSLGITRKNATWQAFPDLVL